jgi:hypothetical protein
MEDEIADATRSRRAGVARRSRSNQTEPTALMSRLNQIVNQGKGIVLLLASILWAAAQPSFAGTGGSKIAPPNSDSGGASLAEWELRWEDAYYFGGDHFGHAFFPIRAGDWETISGTGTFADPLQRVGNADFSLAPGTSIYIPFVVITLEIYDDGTQDDLLPRDWFGPKVGVDKVLIDGQEVIDATNAQEFYIDSIYPAPVYYPSPTDYGAVAGYRDQGFGALIKPLSKGSHTVTMQYHVLVPEWNYGHLVQSTLHITVGR